MICDAHIRTVVDGKYNWTKCGGDLNQPLLGSYEKGLVQCPQCKNFWQFIGTNERGSWQVVKKIRSKK